MSGPQSREFDKAASSVSRIGSRPRGDLFFPFLFLFVILSFVVSLLHLSSSLKATYEHVGSMQRTRQGTSAQAVPPLEARPGNSGRPL